jgi:adenylate cyclase
VTTTGGNICSGWQNSLLGEQYDASILLLAAQEDFVQDVRRLQFTGLILATIAGAAFIPVIWIFGSRMSRSLKKITAQAVKLQKLAEPDLSPVTARIKEVHELSSAMKLAQRAIWSFAHFVPKEIVQRIVLDGPDVVGVFKEQFLLL